MGAAVLGRLTDQARSLVDRLFLGKAYTHRQRLANFPSEVAASLDLRTIAESLVRLAAPAVGASQAALLLPGDEGFVSQFSVRVGDCSTATELVLGWDHPLVAHLGLRREPVAIESDEFSLVNRQRLSEVADAGYGLFCPLMSGERLTGILALGHKESHNLYSQEEISLLMATARGVEGLVGNANRHAAVWDQAYVDGLTGLFNHRLFYETLEQNVRKATRFGLPFSVIMLDIDLFKIYNDTHGHVAGDAVLREVAISIATSIRRIDRAFRYGGEEFAVVLPELGSQDAQAVAERIRRTVEAQMDARQKWLTISAGVASWPKDAVIAAELVACADASLFEAKASGRNCTRQYGCRPSALDGPGSIVGRHSGGVSMVYALAAAVDAKDHYTYGHSHKVSKYSVTVGEEMGLDAEHISVLRNAGLLHDIGKISVPDVVLRKQGPLSREETNQIRSHPEVAVAILRHVEPLAKCLPAILYHHERIDGRGYPLGLAGDQVPLEARIVAVADSYDAMTSNRPYRQPFPPEQALEEMVMCSGQQFDREVVMALGKVIKRPVVGEEQLPIDETVASATSSEGSAT